MAAWSAKGLRTAGDSTATISLEKYNNYNFTLAEIYSTLQQTTGHVNIIKASPARPTWYRGLAGAVSFH